MNPVTAELTTVESVPDHCRTCPNLTGCRQAENMYADTMPVHGFTDTENQCHVCTDCASDTESDSLYPLDFEELDSPAHCAECGVPLIHGLTSDGARYVREAVSSGAGCCRELWPVVWSDYLPDDPYFDRFDICEAYYLYARVNGDYSTIARLHNMGFSPGLSLRTSDVPEVALTDNGQAIYYALISKREGAVR